MGASVFDYLLFLSIIGTVILISLTGSGRIRYNDILDEKDKKVNPKAKDILSIRFGAGYKKNKVKGVNGESEDNSEDEQQN